MYKKNKWISISLYGGFLVSLFLSAVTYSESDFMFWFLRNTFLFLIMTVFISMAAFLSVLFSSEKYTTRQHRILMGIHGGYFIIAMLIYRLLFY